MLPVFPPGRKASVFAAWTARVMEFPFVFVVSLSWLIINFGVLGNERAPRAVTGLTLCMFISSRVPGQPLCTADKALEVSTVYAS